MSATMEHDLAAMLANNDHLGLKPEYRLSAPRRVSTGKVATTPASPLSEQDKATEPPKAAGSSGHGNLQFTVPIPPSLNDAYPSYWKRGKMRRCSTDAVKHFKDEVSLIVQIEKAKQRWAYGEDARFSLAILLRFSNAHRRDISNCVKVLEDAISETLGFDDSAIDQLYVQRISTADKKPGADVILGVIGCTGRN